MSEFFIISGDDDFLRKKRAKECARLLGDHDDPDDPGVEIIAGDANDVKPEAIAGDFLNALRTPPFLSPQKLIWLRHFPDVDLLFSGKAEVYEETIELLSAPLPPEINVLIDGPGLDQRKSAVKNLKNSGCKFELYKQQRSSDKNFAENRRMSIAETVRLAGKTMAPQAMQFFQEAIGSSSGNLANELEKVLLYVGDAPEITLEACREVVSRTPETLSWEFTGAVTSGDTARALTLLSTLLDSGEAELRLIAGLSNEYQRFGQTRNAMTQLKVSRPNPRSFDSIPEELKKRYPDNPLLKMHPYRAFKTCEAALKFPPAELAHNLELIRNASRALVSGGGDNRIIMEQLVLQLTQSQRMRR